MLISDVLSRAGRNKRRRRVGRGPGSGHGKTSGRGHKGMGQHSADQARRLTEGGQMPLFRRIPKRGFSNAQFRKEYQIVNVSALEGRFDDGAKVTAAALEAAGLIRDAGRPVKILGTRAGGKIQTIE
jgi:large subunit ribosomal protein L15